MTDSSRGVAVLTKLKRKAYGAAFDWVLKNKIIYTYLNEDPEVDKQFLNINDQTRLLTITGSGDKGLEYLVEGPGAVRCVDLNYRQNALLDLKLAAFRTCEYDDIWQLFVQGYHADYRAVYTKLRSLLREPSRKFWDAKHSYFRKGVFRRSIYHHGSAGFHLWLSGFAARKRFREIFGADDPDTARQLYDGKIRRMLSNRFVNVVNNRWIGHVLHGLPYPQAAQVKEGHHLDLADRVFRGTTVSENYFWHCYCLGYFKDDCCPKYLRRENFEEMRDRIDRLDFQTISLAGYLQQSEEKFTAFDLLDHQDWLIGNRDALEEEWTWILNRSEPGAKVVIRSLRERVDFIPQFARERLILHEELADSLIQQERSCWYKSLVLAEVK